MARMPLFILAYDMKISDRIKSKTIHETEIFYFFSCICSRDSPFSSLKCSVFELMHRRVREYFTSHVLSRAWEKCSVATHAQCVEERVARDTRRKEIFEINHGSRQQVYRLLHHFSSCIRRVMGDSSETIHMYMYMLFLNYQTCHVSPRKMSIRKYNHFLLIHENYRERISL